MFAHGELCYNVGMSETCQCGCGDPVAPGRRFRQGHAARTAAFKAAVYTPRTADLSPPNPSGLCLCGCGQPTTIATYTDRKRGNIKGHPTRFLRGHSPERKGETRHNWKGGRSMRHGYVVLRLPDHPAADSSGYVPEHRVVWEAANGPLPTNWHIHHINHDRADNRIENLTALSPSDHKKTHGSPTVSRWHADHPGWASETGKLGAIARWRDHQPPPPRTCPVCRADFTPKRPKQKFCKRACYLGAAQGQTPPQQGQPPIPAL